MSCRIPVLARRALLLGTTLVAMLLVGTPTAAAQSSDEQQVMDLSLTEAMRLAFENNLDIRVVSFQRRIAAEQVTAARGAFQPTLTVGLPGAGNFLSPTVSSLGGSSGAGGFGFSEQQVPAATLLAGADVSTSNSFATLTNLGQTLPFGLRYDVTYSLSRATTNSFFQSFDPFWDNTLAVTLSQPLMRGRGEDATAAQLRLARANTEVSEAAFETQVQEVLLLVERAYWQLVFAERDCQRAQTHRPSVELLDDRLEHTRVHLVQSVFVYVQQGERIHRNGPVHLASSPNLGKITHPAQKSVSHARGASRSPRDLGRAISIHF